jgi:hypothetical protein
MLAHDGPHEHVGFSPFSRRGPSCAGCFLGSVARRDRKSTGDGAGCCTRTYSRCNRRATLRRGRKT